MPRTRLTDTVFRDANQSLIQSRMRTADMVEVAGDLDRVGYHSLEVWGGATFEASLRYLNEDPWQRLRALKKVVRDTPLQMLLRGQNLVGYKSYPDDVVRLFVERAATAGVDIFRIYDGLNDLRNMVVPIKAAKVAGRHVQGAISYTVSPIHTVRSFTAMARELVDMGCDSIAIKDMAGLITPGEAGRLVAAVRKATDLPVAFHTHCTSGMGPMAALAAVDAGAEIIDTAISPFAWGASQPPTESMVAALAGGRQETGLDLALLSSIKDKFEALLTKYEPYLDPRAVRTDTNVSTYQIPEWMLVRIRDELAVKGAEKKLPEVLEEIPRVRAEMGYPPLVTPTSQVVGAQAVANVLSEERWEDILPETRDYFLGLFGEPPGKLDPKVRKLAIKDEEPITVRPADLLDPLVDRAKKDLRKAGIRSESPEALLSFILFPVAALRFLRGEGGEEKIEARKSRKQEQAAATGTGAAGGVEYQVEVDGEVFTVRVSGGAAAVVPGVPPAAPAAAAVASPESAATAGAPAPAAAGVPWITGDGALKAPMQGLLLKVLVSAGEAVKLGQPVAVLEAMKMQNDITASKSGTIKEIYVQEGAVVTPGQVLMVIE
ncbi:MAG TPA: pyruvate carboxylase subunit B [Candidatus Dormibacteraeota bacterium]|nr:pyruvate carboxylase subunit B [Candidatus Dormibacteraeota bacterium]